MKQFEIGEIFKVTSGGTPSRDKPEYFENGNIAWIKTGDLKGKYINQPTEHISKAGLENSSAKLFPPKTVLLAMYGATIGACSILPFEATTNQACAAFLPSDNCVETYLYYYLTSIKESLVRLGVGGAQPNISAGLIKKVKIPLPTLAEQQKIAAILDAADSLKQKDQQLVERYTALSQSLFLEMFGDPVTNPRNWKKQMLGNCCSKISVGFVGVCEPFYTDDSGVPMIRTGNLSDTGLKLNNLKYVTRKFHEVQKKSQLKAGDLLIARHGDNGKAVLYKGEFESANCLNIVILRGGSSLTSLFVQYFLNSESTRLMIQSRTGGATQKVINTKEIQKLEIPLAPIDLQNKFAERIQLIEAQKQQAQLSLEKSEALFNSLLQRAFTGELTAKMAA